MTGLTDGTPLAIYSYVSSINEGRIKMERNPNEIVKELDVLDILSNRPWGMTLPEIGNEMGVNWRGLADTVSALMNEGSIEKLGNRYYLMHS